MIRLLKMLADKPQKEKKPHKVQNITENTQT